jgi:hypothetical protein
MSMLSYFRSPFPSTAGFSAYRMPGIAVHGPFLALCVLLGFFLCWPHPTLRPLLIVWVIAGLYLGRDIAILCHYSPILTLVSWAAFGLVFFNLRPIAQFGASSVAFSALLSAAVGTMLVLVAFRMTRERVGDQL